MIESLKIHFKKHLSLAIPVMISQAGQVTVNIADTAMVGRLGKIELGAISLGNAVFIAILVLTFGFSFAMSPLIAQADAQKDQKKVANLFFHGTLLNILLAIILAITAFLLLPLIHQFNQPKDVVTLAVPYVKISLYSLIPLMIFQSLRQLSEGLSLTIPVTIATLLANVVNVILNYAWIYGNFGFPALEVEGAALGTLVARIFMILVLIFILLNWHKCKNYILTFRWKKIQFHLLKKISKLGLPTALQMFFEVSAFSAAAFICGSAGKTDLAAHQIAINLASITFLLCTGLAISGTIRMGNQLGTKNYQNLNKTGWSVILLAALFMMFCGILFVIFRNTLPTFYINNSEVILLTAKLLIIAALFQLSDGVQVVTLGVLRGLQDVTIPTLITFMAYWVIAIPLAYYLAIVEKLGSIGVWYALGVGLTISASCLLLRFRFTSNQIILND